MYFFCKRRAHASGATPQGIEDARIDLTQIDPGVFGALRNACVHQRGLQIRYESMSHPGGVNRLIYPFTLVRIGRRWHVRAWCSEREDYRDFNLGRIRSASRPMRWRPRLPRDELWRKQVAIDLQAHRDLTPAQRDVIRREFFDGGPRRRVDTRACHVSYAIQDLQAAIEPTRQTPPEFQLEVINVKALKPYLFC